MRKLVFILLFFCLTTPCFAVTQLLKTVKPSGGDYTSLEACMNANEQNLVTVDKYFDVEIDGTWSSADTTAVTIELYTTDATRYINIYTTATARHLGVYSTSYYRLSIAGNHTILNSTKNLRITGLQCINQTSGFWTLATITATNIEHIFSKNIFIKDNLETGGAGAVLVDNGDNGIVYLFNNIIYCTAVPSNSFGIDTRNNTYTAYIYSNTVYRFSKGISTGGTSIVAKNNIAYNNTTDYSGTFAAASTNNLSKDATAPPLNTYYINKTLTFVSTTAGSEDLHLALGDTDAIDLGVNTSGESAPLNFTDDIDGVTRGVLWEIGADDFGGAAARRMWTFQ